MQSQFKLYAIMQSNIITQWIIYHQLLVYSIYKIITQATQQYFCLI